MSVSHVARIRQKERKCTPFDQKIWRTRNTWKTYTQMGG